MNKNVIHMATAPHVSSTLCGLDTDSECDWESTVQAEQVTCSACLAKLGKPDVEHPAAIETAPRDVAVLSDVGVVRYIYVSEYAGDPGRYLWVECSPKGEIRYDRDGGLREASPTRWAPLPEWMK